MATFRRAAWKHHIDTTLSPSLVSHRTFRFNRMPDVLLAAVFIPAPCSWNQLTVLHFLCGTNKLHDLNSAVRTDSRRVRPDTWIFNPLVFSRLDYSSDRRIWGPRFRFATRTDFFSSSTNPNSLQYPPSLLSVQLYPETKPVKFPSSTHHHVLQE